MIFELKYIFYNAKSTFAISFLGLSTYLILAGIYSSELIGHRSRSEVAETYDGYIPMYLIDLIVGGERGHTVRAGLPLKI